MADSSQRQPIASGIPRRYCAHMRHCYVPRVFTRDDDGGNHLVVVTDVTGIAIPTCSPRGPPVAENRDHFAYSLYQTRLRRPAAPSTTTLTFVGMKLLPAFGSCGQFAIVIESPPRSAG